MLFIYKKTTTTRTKVYIAAALNHVRQPNEIMAAFCLDKVLVFAFVLLVLDVVYVVSGEFENSWTMYKEQPCCSGSGSHHVRHHRGRLSCIPTCIFGCGGEARRRLLSKQQIKFCEVSDSLFMKTNEFLST